MTVQDIFCDPRKQNNCQGVSKARVNTFHKLPAAYNKERPKISDIQQIVVGSC